MSKTTGLEENSPATANEHDDEKQAFTAANQHDDENQEHAVGMNAKNQCSYFFSNCWRSYADEGSRAKVSQPSAPSPDWLPSGPTILYKKIDHYY